MCVVLGKAWLGVSRLGPSQEKAQHLLQRVIQCRAHKCPRLQAEVQRVEAHVFTFKVTVLELPAVCGGTWGWLSFQPIQLFRSSLARLLLLKRGADGAVEHQVNVMRL